MTVPRYEMLLRDFVGKQTPLEPIAGGAVRVVGKQGVVWGDFVGENFDPRTIVPDQLLELWRGLGDAPLMRINSGFLRKYRVFRNNDGALVLRLIAPDINELAVRRIVAYNAGESQTTKTDEVDDFMLEVVDENFVSATDASRNIADLLTLGDTTSSGASVTLDIARETLDSLLENLVDMSITNTPNMFYEFQQIGDQYAFQFVIHADQPGIDHVELGISPVVFSEAFGNLRNPDIEFDYTKEVTNVYGLGTGVNDQRIVKTADDTDREARSPIGRREAAVYSSSQSENGVQADADAALAAGLPRLTFSGELLDVEPYRFGREWNFGDRVPVEFLGLTFKSLVAGVRLDFADAGESLKVYAKVTDVISE